MMGASAKMVKEAEVKEEPILINKQNSRKNLPSPGKKKVKSIARATLKATDFKILFHTSPC